MKMNQSEPALGEISAAFGAGEQIYLAMGSPLYASLCVSAADNTEILELATHAEENARPIHLFTAVHHLLLHNPGDPLARFFTTLTDNPGPPEEAFPDFLRYCRDHRQEILDLLGTHTVQMTYAERCRALLPVMSLVGREVGKPLHIAEIGCSAGVLLTFDRYRYEYDGRDPVGHPDAPLTLRGELHGGPTPVIPEIRSRTGIDLHIVDVKSEEQRRWVLASTFPELREQQARLAVALDVVAQSGIRFLEGDGLALLPEVIGQTPDPLCVFHSACLMYWSREAKAALEQLLREAGRDREIYRIGLEPSESFSSWQQGRSSGEKRLPGGKPPTGDITVTRYHNGRADTRMVAHNNRSDYGSVQWLD